MAEAGLEEVETQTEETEYQEPPQQEQEGEQLPEYGGEQPPPQQQQPSGGDQPYGGEQQQQTEYGGQQTLTSSSGANSDMGRNLIVNYIPPSFSEADLSSLFSPYGELESCKIVHDQGRSLGYGFVKFINVDNATNAISGLNGTPVMNKVLKVSVAKPSSTPGKGANLYVSNLEPHTNEDVMREIFSPYGTILEVKALMDYKTNQCKGVGFVRMHSKDEALAVIRNLNNQSVPQLSKPIQVKFADNNNENRSKGMIRNKTTNTAFTRYDPYSVYAAQFQQ
eukprot:CAMPEP_0201538270 /NCGR_PEP_ID=MMETSP0161_2-20130828/67140_1 /ASSEMBLY_ACC=CAM_ASM_000251 /TAXON_ID=180227 /ORGANISM="Neoparamoeba aestuarina, Strain SoJaBio B1-5/56/2" /LENGTH=279 /DNA_ID=CAMNT_0047945021 /DNA_START=33 /DNA_END=869 /DNA_ORIENTATION=-